MGSSTLMVWIQKHLDSDASGGEAVSDEKVVEAAGVDGGLDDSGPWPDLVGMDGDEAIGRLTERFPAGFATVHKVPQDAMVTMDYREDRIRVFIDEEGKVARPPKFG